MIKPTLYLKHRPQSLDEIVGNKEIVQLLRNQLEDGTMPRSLLFHGPTGCGKTTLARIVGHELGIAGNDLREIDSADFRGIDTVREIRRQSGYRPLEGPARMWILDECHKMTGDAQTALLKALEDTPSHVYYVLCTTEPQKLLPTIRGRCAQYQVRPLTDKEMRILLRRVVIAEEDSITKDLYDQIIQDALGHPRNALQVLAQVLSVEPDQRMKVAKRSAAIQSKTIDLCRILLKKGSWSQTAKILTGLKEEDPESIRRAVLGYCQAILLQGQTNDMAAVIIQEFLEPFYNVGFPGLTFACYSVICGGDDD